MQTKFVALLLALIFATAGSAQPTAIFSSFGDLSVVPGTNQVFDRFDRPVRSPDGRYWFMLARNTGDTTTDAMFLSGQGAVGTLEWWEGTTPVIENRTASSSDRYVAINNSGQWVALANLVGSTSDDELVFGGSVGGSGQYIVYAREGRETGDGTPGQTYAVSSYAPNISTDGTVSFGFTLAGFPSGSDLHYYTNNGDTLVVNEAGPGPQGQAGGDDAPWDNGFSSNSFQVTGNQQHWLIRGKLDNGTTNTDDVLVVNNQVVVQEGSGLDGAGPVGFITGDQNMLTENGDWFLRGRLADGSGFAARSGQILAKDSDPIQGLPGEHWDGSLWTSSSATTFFVAVGNNNGDYVLGGYTDHVDPDLAGVWIYNGEPFMRLGDQVDIDADGQLDDAYIYVSSFTSASPKALGGFLTDDGWFYFTADLENAAEEDLGEAFLRIRVAGDCPFDLDDNGAIGPGDVGVVKNSFGCDINQPTCAALDFDNNGAVGPGDVGAVKNEFGPCP